MSDASGNGATNDIGISYYRFSSARQGKEGKDSLTRQMREFQSFCERWQLTPAKEGYSDKGMSGFTGKHRKKGDMRRLIMAAEQKAFLARTVIVVETWDRMGRLRPDKQTELVARLLRTGVRIGICRLNEIFAMEDFGTHKWTTLAVFAQLAYQESKQKSDRKRSANQHALQRAREKKLTVLTHHLPAWVAEEGGKLVPYSAERLEAVRRMFELASAGLGYGNIGRRLHTEGIAPFDGERWCRSYVRFVLTDRRALGEHQPTTTRVRKDRDGKDVLDDDGDEIYETVPDGEPIASYYPVAVSEAEFAEAQAGRAGRTLRKGKSNVWSAAEDELVRTLPAAEVHKLLENRGVRRTYTAVYQRKRRLARMVEPTPTKIHHEPTTVNVFARLLKDARNPGGAGYTVVFRMDSGAPVPVLVNGSCRDGNGSRCFSFPYRTFEGAVLSELAEVDPTELVGRKPSADDEVSPIRVERDCQREKVKTLEDIQSQEPSLANARVLRAVEDRLKQLESELLAARQRAAHPIEAEWKQFHDCAEALAAADDPSAARLKLRTVLRNAVDCVHMLVVRRGQGRLAAVQVEFREGTRRGYLVRHQPPKGNRHGKNLEPGFWQSRSWTDEQLRKAMMPTQFDLRHENPTALGDDDHGHTSWAAGWADVEMSLKGLSAEDLETLVFAGCARHELP